MKDSLVLVVVFVLVAIVGNELWREWNIRYTFDHGTCPAIKVSHRIERKELVADLVSLLKDCPSSSFYYFIVGGQGTGKTTAVCEACTEVGKGVIYVEVPDDVYDFPSAFAKAFGHDTSFLHQLFWSIADAYNIKAGTGS